MSRAIPRVRRWRVRFYMGCVLLADMVVDAVDRRFARWAARDRMRAVHFDRWLATDRMTVSPMTRQAPGGM